MRIACVPIPSGLKKDPAMNVNEDLIGKTITGVVATGAAQGKKRVIWMLQFADGSHVEFVSPRARQALKRGSRRMAKRPRAENSPQLALNVA